MRQEDIDLLLDNPDVIDIEIRNRIKHHIGVTLGYIVKPIDEPGAIVRVMAHWKMDKSRFKDIFNGACALKSFVLSGLVDLLAVTDFYSPAVTVEEFKKGTKKTPTALDTAIFEENAYVDKKLMPPSEPKKEEDKEETVVAIITSKNSDPNPFEDGDQMTAGPTNSPPKPVTIKKKK